MINRNDLADLKGLLRARDLDTVNQGLAIAQGLADPDVFDLLLDGVGLKQTSGYQEILPNALFTDGPGQRWMDHALRGLIAYAPEGSQGAALRARLTRPLLRGEGRSGYNRFDVPVDLRPLEALPGLASVRIMGAKEILGLEAFTALPRLELSRCEIPESVAALSGLRELVLEFCSRGIALDRLPQGLEKLSLTSNEWLTSLAGLEGRVALRELELMSNRKLVDVQALATLAALERLDLSATPIQSLPTLPRGLQLLWLPQCFALRDLEGLRGLSGLTTLSLLGCQSITSLAPLEITPRVQLTTLKDCKSLTDLAGLEHTQSRMGVHLDLTDCHALEDISALSSFPYLERLSLKGCRALRSIAPLASVRSTLEWLILRGCAALEDVDALAGAAALTLLALDGCASLRSVAGLRDLPSLRYAAPSHIGIGAQLGSSYKDSEGLLDLTGAAALEGLDGMGGLPKIRRVSLSGAASVTSLAGLQGLPQLASLDLTGCAQLTSLEDLLPLEGLSGLTLSGCDQLRPKPKRVKMEEPAKVRAEINRHRPKAARAGSGGARAGGSRATVSRGDLSKIKKLLQARDLDTIHQGIAIASQDAALCAALLEDVQCVPGGESQVSLFAPNPIFSGTGPAQPWLDYALRGLIAAAVDCGPAAALRAQVTSLDAGALGPQILDARTFSGFPNLARLDLSGCAALTDLTPLQDAPALEVLSLQGCASLVDLSSLSRFAQRLRQIDVSSCPVHGLEGIGGPALEQVIAQRCDALRDLNALAPSPALALLDLSACSALQHVNGLQGMTGLRALNLQGCHQLVHINGLQGLAALRTLILQGCRQLLHVDGLQGMTGLRALNLQRCDGLRQVDALAGLDGLTQLGILSATSADVSGLTALLERANARGAVISKSLTHAGRPRSSILKRALEGKPILELD